MAEAAGKLDTTIAAAITAYRGALAAYEVALASIETEYATALNVAEHDHTQQLARAEGHASAAAARASDHEARVKRLADKITRIRDASHRIVEAAATVYLGGHEGGALSASSTSNPMTPDSAQLSTALADANLLLVDLAAECWSVVGELLQDGHFMEAIDLGDLIEHEVPSEPLLTTKQLGVDHHLRTALERMTRDRLEDLVAALTTEKARPSQVRHLVLTEVEHALRAGLVNEFRGQLPAFIRIGPLDRLLFESNGSIVQTDEDMRPVLGTEWHTYPYTRCSYGDKILGGETTNRKFSGWDPTNDAGRMLMRITCAGGALHWLHLSCDTMNLTEATLEEYQFYRLVGPPNPSSRSLVRGGAKWSLEKGRLLADTSASPERLRIIATSVRSFDVSSDGRLLAVEFNDGHIEIRQNAPATASSVSDSTFPPPQRG